MADAAARFVLIGEDRTKAAFSSADRGLRQLQRSVAGTRQMLQAFGVVLSGRALLSWVTNAVKAADATGEYGKRIKAAQDAMAGMKKASDELAVSVGIELTGAFQGLGKVLTGLNAFFFNADATPFAKQIADIEEKIREMRKHAIDTGIGELLYSAKDQATIAKLQADLAALIKKQEQALGVGVGGLKPASALFGDGLEEISTAYGRMPKDLRRDFDFAGASAAVLNSELQEIGAVVTKMPDDLKQLSPEFTNAAAALRQYNGELSKSAEFAQSLGDDFEDAFTGWILGAERSFSDFLERMAVQMATSALLKGLATLFPGGSFFANFFAGSRASGGSVREGKMYKVHPGEAFFTPGSDGHVAAAGGPSMHFETHIDARGADPSLAHRLPSILAENNQRLKAEIKHELGRRR